MVKFTAQGNQLNNRRLQPDFSQFLLPKALSSAELKTILTTLKGWTKQEGKLHRQFRFNSFEKALGFMSGLSIVAEKMGHQPEESNVYNCVTVDLTTDEVGGISNLDVQLAKKANELASSLQNN